MFEKSFTCTVFLLVFHSVFPWCFKLFTQKICSNDLLKWSTLNLYVCWRVGDVVGGCVMFSSWEVFTTSLTCHLRNTQHTGVGHHLPHFQIEVLSVPGRMQLRRVPVRCVQVRWYAQGPTRASYLEREGSHRVEVSWHLDSSSTTHVSFSSTTRVSSSSTTHVSSSSKAHASSTMGVRAPPAPRPLPFTLRKPLPLTGSIGSHFLSFLSSCLPWPAMYRPAWPTKSRDIDTCQCVWLCFGQFQWEHS